MRASTLRVPVPALTQVSCTPVAALTRNALAARRSGRGLMGFRQQRRLLVLAVWLLLPAALAQVTSQAALVTALNGVATSIIVAANFTLTSALPVIARSLSITGDPNACAPGLCTISGGGLYRVFEVYSASAAVTLTLNTLGVVGGSDAVDNKGGGGVLLLPGPSPNFPALVATGCVFQNNTANGIGPGGAIAANGAAVVAANMPLTLTNCRFVGNSAWTMAGAVFAYGTTVVSGSTFASNTVNFPGAQLSNTSLGNSGSNGLGFGGGLALGTCATGGLTVSSSSFTSNWATSGGGIMCGPACTCTIQTSTFTNNSAVGTFLVGGAGVAGCGGAVGAFPGATLAVSGTAFSANVASSEGGSVYMSGTKQGSINYALGGMYGVTGHTGFAASSAAAVFTLPVGQAAPAVSAAPVTATITGCTVTGSSSSTGGGVYLEGSAAVLTMANTVISYTSASKKGGGLYMVSNTNTTLSNVSITGSSASTGGGCVGIGACTAVCTMSCCEPKLFTQALPPTLLLTAAYSRVAARAPRAAACSLT